MSDPGGAAEEKLLGLRDLLQGYGRVLVGYSGGVDSTFLLSVASEELGADALGVTAVSVLAPSWELADAERLASVHGWNHRALRTDPLSLMEVRENPPDRCYHCKQTLFRQLTELAREEGFAFVLDGANKSDESDYRPGSRATAELGVRSPLADVGLRKDEIRRLARERGLDNWNKPACACLASRIPYGTALEAGELERIDRAERFLHELGYSACRVRVHGEVARIELPPEAVAGFVTTHGRAAGEALRDMGYRHVAVDLKGYTMGSLNPEGAA